MNTEVAILLAKSEWWKNLTPREIAIVQLQEEYLMMPFGEFQQVVEKALGRSIFTHEFGTRNAPQRLLDEVRAAK